MPRKSDPNAPNKPRGKAFRPGEDERRLDTREPKPPLPNLRDETDVQAMEALWLQKGKPETRRQDAWAPLYRKNLAEYRRQMDKLAGKPGAAGDDPSPETAVKYDAAGSCPTCGRGPDPIGPDAGEERVEEQLAAEWSIAHAAMLQARTAAGDTVRGPG